VVFAWHDELGTVVPQQREIVIPEVDFTDTPDWSYRWLAYGPVDQTYKLLGRRLRLGSTITTGCGHAWYRILSAEEYGEEHPEYFALVDGKRRTTYYLGHHGEQVCTSNPEAIEIFAQTAIDFFNEYPQFGMFSISPNDGGGLCECDNCRALDGGHTLPNDPKSAVLSDRMLAFYNAVAKRVAKVHPDKLLGATCIAITRTRPSERTCTPTSGCPTPRTAPLAFR